MKNIEEINDDLRMKSVHISLRLSQKDHDLLERYCTQEQVNKSDMIRHFIRTLKNKVK